MGDRLLAVEHCSTAGTRRHRTAELRGSPAPWLRGLAGLPPQAAAAAEPDAAQPAPAPAPAERATAPLPPAAAAGQSGGQPGPL